MKIEQTTIINNTKCSKDCTMKGLDIYTNDEEEILYICKNGDAFLEISVEAYSCEGGGGSLIINRI